MVVKGEANCCCCGWAYKRSVLRQVRRSDAKGTVIALICATCQARVARAKTDSEERK